MAVDFCHTLGIANRDIKLENALIMRGNDDDDVELKLCDFGYSKDELVSGRRLPVYAVLCCTYSRLLLDLSQSTLFCSLCSISITR